MKSIILTIASVLFMLFGAKASKFQVSKGKIIQDKGKFYVDFTLNWKLFGLLPGQRHGIQGSENSRKLMNKIRS